MLFSANRPCLSGNSALSTLSHRIEVANQFEGMGNSVGILGQHAVPACMQADLQCDSAPRLVSTAFGFLRILVSSAWSATTAAPAVRCPVPLFGSKGLAMATALSKILANDRAELMSDSSLLYQAQAGSTIKTCLQAASCVTIDFPPTDLKPAGQFMRASACCGTLLV